MKYEFFNKKMKYEFFNKMKYEFFNKKMKYEFFNKKMKYEIKYFQVMFFFRDSFCIAQLDYLVHYSLL